MFLKWARCPSAHHLFTRTRSSFKLHTILLQFPITECFLPPFHLFFQLITIFSLVFLWGLSCSCIVQPVLRLVFWWERDSLHLDYVENSSRQDWNHVNGGNNGVFKGPPGEWTPLMGPALSSEYKVTSDKHGEEGRRAQKGGGRLPAGLSCIPLDSVRGVFWILLVRQRERIPRFFFVCMEDSEHYLYCEREGRRGKRGKKCFISWFV